MAEGGIFLDILTRLNMASVDRVLKDVKLLMREAGKESGRGFSEAFSVDGAVAKFKELSNASDMAYRQMQTGLAELQRAEAGINDLRARNYAATSAAMIDAQHAVDAALANTSKLIADSNKALADQRAAAVAAVPTGRGGRERGGAADRGARTSGRSGATTAAEAGAIGGAAGAEAGSAEADRSEAGAATSDIGKHVLAHRFASHIEERRIGRGIGLASTLGSGVFLGTGIKQSVAVHKDMEQVLATHQDRLHTQAYGARQIQGIYGLAGEGPYDSKQLAEVYKDVENQGYTGTAAIQVLKTAMQTAVATGSGDLKQTTEGLMTNLEDFGTQAELTSGNAKRYTQGLKDMNQQAGQLVQAVGSLRVTPDQLYSALGTVEPTAMTYMKNLPGGGPQASAQIMAMLDELSRIGIKPEQGAHNVSRLISTLGSPKPGSNAYKMMGQLGLKPQDIADTVNNQGPIAAFEAINAAIDSRKITSGTDKGKYNLGWKFESKQVQDLVNQDMQGLSPGATAFVDANPQIGEGLASRYSLRKPMDQAIRSGQISKEEAQDIVTLVHWQSMLHGPNAFTKQGSEVALTRGQVFQNMFGTGDIARTGANVGMHTQDIKDMSDQIFKTGSSVLAKAFHDMMGNLPAQWKKLGSAVKSLASQAADHLVPLFTQWASDLSGMMSRHKWAAQKVIDAMLAAAGAWVLFKLHIPQLLAKITKMSYSGIKSLFGSGKESAPAIKAGGAATEGEGAATLQEAATTLETGAATFQETSTVFSGAATIFSEAVPVFSEGATAFSAAAPAFETGATTLETSATTLEGAATALETAATAQETAATALDTSAATIDSAALGMGAKMLGAINPVMIAGLIDKQVLNTINPGINRDAPPKAQRTFWGALKSWMSNGESDTNPNSASPGAHPGKARGGIVGYWQGGGIKTANPYTQPLMDMPDTGGDSVLGMLPDGSVVGLRGKEGILTPDAVDALGGEEGINSINANPWNNPFKVATTFYGSFSKGVAKYSPWGKYLEASSKGLDALEKEFEKSTKEHEVAEKGIYEGEYGKSGYYGQVWRALSKKLPKAYHGKHGTEAIAAGDPNVMSAIKQAYMESGFPPDQYGDLLHIIQNESSFNPTAVNPKSGAYGLAQFLGHENDRYGAEGGYSGNPLLETKAMLDYIHHSHGGTPASNWSYWQSHGNYAKGGVVGYSPGGVIPQDTTAGPGVSPIAPLDPPTNGKPNPGPGVSSLAPLDKPDPGITPPRHPGYNPAARPPPPAPKSHSSHKSTPPTRLSPQGDKAGTAPRATGDRNIKKNPSRAGGQENTSKGFSVGGGLIGGAEGAAAAAGGPFGAAAQPAMQLINRAIGYGGQLVGIGMEGLLQTFTLNDSKLGDPTNSLFGKVALGIAGAHPSPKNSAGVAAQQFNPKQDLDQGAMAGKQTIPQVHMENTTIHNHGNDMDYDGMQRNIASALHGMGGLQSQGQS